MVLATTRFEVLTRTVARSLGLPDARVVVVEHPLGGTDPETVLRWADAAVDEFLGHLTA